MIRRKDPSCMCSECKAAINWDAGRDRLFIAEFARGPVGMAIYGTVSIWAMSLEDAVIKAKAETPPSVRVTDVWRSYRCLFETFSPTYSVPFDL